ncbi:hypothetical protein niasHT_005926 [Heterodera trifolii]|uniref:Uncharacterized protein n=1 Tax=Heterodera trifolii TaxID=157864 RepID=A0ABD2LT50_9BILA
METKMENLTVRLEMQERLTKVKINKIVDEAQKLSRLRILLAGQARAELDSIDPHPTTLNLGRRFNGRTLNSCEGISPNPAQRRRLQRPGQAPLLLLPPTRARCKGLLDKKGMKTMAAAGDQIMMAVAGDQIIGILAKTGKRVGITENKLLRQMAEDKGTKEMIGKWRIIVFLSMFAPGLTQNGTLGPMICLLDAPSSLWSSRLTRFVPRGLQQK